MGVHQNITHDRFPRQSDYVGRRTVVCFHYDTAHEIGGVLIRDDREAPGESIIQLDDGRIVRGVECQYRLPLREAK